MAKQQQGRGVKVGDKLLAEEAVLLGVAKLELPTGYLSPSQIEMYCRCPMQYEWRYIKKLKQPPGVALVEGTATHAAMELNNLHKVKKHVDLKAKSVVDCFCDTFSKEKKQIEDWAGETEKSVVERGRAVIPRYLDSFAPRFQPEVVEHELRFMVGPVEVLGYVDVAGQLSPVKIKSKLARPTVVDYKTSAKGKTEADLAGSVQLTFYGWGGREFLGAKDPDVGFCVFKKTRQPEVEWQSTRVSAGRIKWFRRLTLRVADSISRGAFPPCDPTSWCCCPRFCGFYSQCRGACK